MGVVPVDAADTQSGRGVQLALPFLVANVQRLLADDADAAPDPWSVLELAPGSDLAAARARWRKMVREAHPDRAMARGLPPEAVKLAEERVIALNRAWAEISAGAKQAAL